MNTTYITNNPNLGSTARILQSWLRLAREAGDGAVVVAQREGDFTDWLRREGVEHLVDPMPWLDKRRPWKGLFHAVRVARWLRRRGVDIIHCNEHDTYPFGALVAKVARLPIVCHVRCKINAGFGQWAFGKRTPDALIWCSPQMQAECSSAVEGVVPSERQHMIPLGLDSSSFGQRGDARSVVRRSWNVTDNDVVVGMASALRPGKRIEDFLELAQRRTGCHERVRFVLAGGPIAGDEQYRDWIVPQIERAVARGEVRWLGHLEPIEPFLHAIDVYVSTSEHESFGMSVCEAMACRRAVAAYRACSVEFVVGSAGRTVPTGDLDALARAVAELTSNEDVRRRLGEQAYQRVATAFNPRNSYEQIQGIYERILDMRRSRRAAALL